MIGPDIPAHFLSGNRSTTPEDDEEAGPSLAEPPAPSIGPAIPPEILASAPNSAKPANDEEDDDDDDYTPALPPDLAASRIAGPSSSSASTQTKPKPIVGPAFPPSLSHTHDRYYDDDDSDDDEVGPKPPPGGVVQEETDGVREFIEREERRRKQAEEAAKPKALKREEWMLVPPSSSDLLGSIDPTKLTKPRQFARTAAPAREVDNTLWTETPAERQQRLADEVAGKRRRAVNADPNADEDVAEARKKRKRDEELRKGVDEYTRKHRGATLLAQHAEKSAKTEKKDNDEGPPVIWDHSRDMALGGRLMDDRSREKFIKDARGLSDRFGTGKSGGFM
ncbi:hypothetical protein K474DRAFT_1706416 [Panus rudis PR-1116 ss-1]|nr:hypothetical protein K474DRAFT_1706416 [Panus rudis PR-1116 ss-1]